MRSIDELFTELVRLNVKLWGENGDLRYKAPQGVLTPALRAELGQRKAEILTFLQKTEALPAGGSCAGAALFAFPAHRCAVCLLGGTQRRLCAGQYRDP